MLNYNDINIEDEDAIHNVDQYEIHLNNLLYTYNSSNTWYNDTCIFEPDGYIKDIINTNNIDTSHYVKIPALKSIINNENGDNIDRDSINEYIKNITFTDGNVMGVEYTVNEDAKFIYFVVDDASKTSKFNNGNYSIVGTSDALYSKFNEAINSSNNNSSYISTIHRSAVE